VIDIKSRFFTVYARGRVCSPTAPLAAARIKALVERRDVVNILNAYPLAGSGTGLSPTPGADGITDAVNVLWKRFVTEY
jgi:hypothetical protein